ncbi:LptF/LptG family permease [Candidatus Bandiella euplotis]|uniref:ABC transporter permease n=1 Tax=Candidatus Bandiella euplotis TaxID=1664265 RepID=A0ABZ0UKT6_9RICK|nr:LptF/LptG family permease [Candidatus Bandiella woodruffii]WPX96744.1 ABC transporter permease [Candidatus Bandiella woodruffii]
MHFYERYICKSLLLPFLIITFSIVGIAWIIQSIRYLEIVLNNGAKIADFAKLTSYLIPLLLFIVLPISLFFTVYYTYRKLMHDREITALYSFGVSKIAIVRIFTIFSIFAMLLHYFVSIYLLPVSTNAFKKLRFTIDQNSIINLIQFNTFISKINGITIYIEKKDQDNLLQNIFIHSSQNPEKDITFVASSGKFYNTDSRLKLILNNGSKLELNHADKRYSLVKFDKYSMDSFGDTAVAQSISKQDPYALGIAELLFSNSFPVDETPKFRAQGHFRLLWPLTSISIVMSMLFFLTQHEQVRTQGMKPTIYAFTSLLVIIASALALYTLGHSNQKYYILMYLLNIIIPLIVAIRLYSSTKNRLLHG